MNSYRIMLCCGAGMSSGFMAQRTRQAAKKKGIAVTVDARGESQVTQYLGSIDLLMIGPHYSSQLPHYEELCRSYNCKVCIIPQNIYGPLDGEALLKLALGYLQDKKEE